MGEPAQDAAAAPNPPGVGSVPAAQQAPAEQSGPDDAAAALPADGNTFVPAEQPPVTKGAIVADVVDNSGFADQPSPAPAGLPAAVPEAPVIGPDSIPASNSVSQPDNQPDGITLGIAAGAPATAPPQKAVTVSPGTALEPAALEPSSVDITKPLPQPIPLPPVAPIQPVLTDAAADAQTPAYVEAPDTSAGADAGIATADTTTAGRHRRAAQPSAKVLLALSQEPSIALALYPSPIP